MAFRIPTDEEIKLLKQIRVSNPKMKPETRALVTQVKEMAEDGWLFLEVPADREPAKYLINVRSTLATYDLSKNVVEVTRHQTEPRILVVYKPRPKADPKSQSAATSAPIEFNA